MRFTAKYPYKDWECRVISGFLLWPRRLTLPKEQSTEYTNQQWRWLEHAVIEQFYSHLNRCWIDSKWRN